MNLPPGNNTEVLDKRYKYQLDSVYFHYDSVLYTGSGSALSNAYAPEPGKAINIFYMRDPDTTNVGGGQANQFGVRWVKLENVWQKYVVHEDYPDMASIWANARDISHEIGHNLSLDHTLQNNNGGDCIDVDDHCFDTPLYSYLTADLGLPSPCCSFNDPFTYCSNNLMDYVGPGAVTPCQLQRVHFTLMYDMEDYIANDFCSPNEIAPFVIDGQTLVWNNKRYFDRDVILTNGAHLTVNCELRFGVGKGIIVESGAELVIDGGHITSACNDGRWHGIYVEGPVGDHQNSSICGKVSLINGAMISKALSGVNNFGLLEDGCSKDWSTLGGIIQSENSLFIDNKRDAQFLKHTNFNSNGDPEDDLSYFKNTDFITSADYQGDPVQNVTLWATRGIPFLSCTFMDERPFGQVSSPDRRIGLYTSGAGYMINKDCDDPSDPDCSAPPTRFIDMAYGIHSTGGKFNPITVRRAEFDCFKGAYLLRCNFTQLTDNQFLNERYEDSSGNDQRPYGLYMDECRAYQVEGNVFGNKAAPDELLAHLGDPVGLVVRNDHEEVEEIYRNTFNSLPLAVEAVGLNKRTDPFDFTGLQIRCNEFNDDLTDIYVRVEDNNIEHGIARWQGLEGGATDQLAGNLFSDLTAVLGYDDNYINATDQWIDYFMHDPANDPRVEPTYDSGVSSMQTHENSGTEWTDSESCPNLVTKEFIVTESTQDKSQESSSRTYTQSILNIEVDDGNTQAMQWEVMSVDQQNAWLKYLDLMAKAGYLSEEVLREVAAEEDGFSHAMIRDILYANPQAAKDEETQVKLNERSDPLPDYMRQQIDQGLTELSAKEYLEFIRDSHKYRHDMVIDRTVAHLMRKQGDYRSDILDMLGGTGDLDFDMKIVSYYLSNGDGDLADGFLNILLTQYPSNKDQESINEVITLSSALQSWKNSGKDFTDLNIADIALLEDYSTSTYAFTQAAELLSLNGVNEIEEAHLPAGNEKSNRQRRYEPQTAKGEGRIALFPNPTSDHVTIDYKFKGEGLNLRLIDVHGKIVYREALNAVQNQVILSLKGFDSGTYRLTIIDNKGNSISDVLVVEN